MASPLNKIERAHQMYRDGRYQEALGFYTEALSMAKTNPQKIALHSNRAACYLKLHAFKKAAEECTSVLELDCNHSGALMLRAQTLVTLKEYHSALFDVNRLMDLNPSSEVYKNLETRLRTQLSLATIPESEEEEEEMEEAESRRDEASLPQSEGAGDTEVAITKLVEEININRESEVGSLSPEGHLNKEPSDQGHDQKVIPESAIPEAQTVKDNSKGWPAIPKPKGHSTLDYARWDNVEDNSSEDDSDEEDEEEYTPQYRFRVRTAGVRPVK